MTDDLEPSIDPAAKYQTPQQLAEDASLSVDERRRLLDEWEDDIRIRVVASEEGMTGPNAQVGLADILAAKKRLPVAAPARDTQGKA